MKIHFLGGAGTVTGSKTLIEHNNLRILTTDSQGRALAIFLPRGQAVRGGDVLLAETARWCA